MQGLQAWIYSTQWIVNLLGSFTLLSAIFASYSVLERQRHPLTSVPTITGHVKKGVSSCKPTEHFFYSTRTHNFDNDIRTITVIEQIKRDEMVMEKKRPVIIYIGFICLILAKRAKYLTAQWTD